MSRQNACVAPLAILGSCLFSILLLEAGLRLYFHFVGNFDVEMWRYTQALKLSVPDGRSHVHRPNASARVEGADVRINSKGLRDPERGYEKPPGCTRILLAGDSFTFGFGVEAEQTFARRLERMLNAGGPGKYEVINGGVGNYNTAQELAFVQNEGYKYHPDQIVLAFFINDAEPTQKFEAGFLASRSLAFILARSLTRRLADLFHPPRHYEEYYRRLYQGESWTRYTSTMDAFVAESRKLGARLTVLILPELHSLKPYPFRDVHKLVSDYFRSKGCDVIDALDAFPETGDARKFWAAPDDPHPNAEAHRLIAEILFRELKATP